MTTPLLAQGVNKRFGTHTVLENIDVRVDPGELVALVGPNGSGKSTLLGCLCGTVVPDDGRVTIGGRPLHSDPVGARAQLRYLPQEVDVPAGLTGRELLGFYADVYDARRALPQIEQWSGLGDALERLATTYSVGMRRRLAFAAHLAGEPALMILDEPFAGVDHDGRAAMIERLTDKLSAGVGIIVAAHDRDLDDLARLDPRRQSLRPST